jgi:hypothetical protein
MRERSDENRNRDQKLRQVPANFGLVDQDQEQDS